MVKGLSEEAAADLTAARNSHPWHSVEDLAARAGLNDQSLRYLARAGALAQISGHRHQAHWQVAGVQRPMALQAHIAEAESPYHHALTSSEDDIELPSPGAEKELLDDYRYTGLTLGPHPMALLRQRSTFENHRTAADLLHCRQGQPVRVAGLVTGRQRPGTATGVVFLTLEDETGNINVVIWSSILQRFRAALLQGQLLQIKGVVEREGLVVHVVAGYVEDSSTLLSDLGQQALPFKSRDFH
jgi:error-prone DNA polymerase